MTAGAATVWMAACAPKGIVVRELLIRQADYERMCESSVSAVTLGPSLYKVAGGRVSKEQFESWVDSAVPFATGAGLVVAVVVTALADVPSPLPGIALGSEALLYIERGAAVMGAIVVLLMLLAHGLKGILPSQASTGGVGYPDPVKAVASKSEAAVEGLAERIDKLDEARSGHVQALRLLHEMIQSIEKKVDALQESNR